MISAPNQSYSLVSLFSAASRVCKSRDGKHRLLSGALADNATEAVVSYCAVYFVPTVASKKVRIVPKASSPSLKIPGKK